MNEEHITETADLPCFGRQVTLNPNLGGWVKNSTFTE